MSQSFFLFSFLTRFTLCFILPIRKFISSDDSVSEVSRSDITISVRTSPKCCILVDCLSLSVSLCSSTNSRFNSRTLAKVSMIAIVAAVACGDFSIVANMYRPFSVKTLVVLRLFGETFVVKIFDRKSRNSLLVNSKN